MFNELRPEQARVRPASRDLSDRLAAVRRIVQSTHAATSNDISDTESFDLQSEVAQSSFQPLFKEAELEERLKWAKGLTGDTKQLVVQQLHRAKALGCLRRLAAPPDANALDTLEVDFPHFAWVVRLMRRRCALARCSPNPALHLPPLLLSGPPGAGKTAFAKRLAKLMSAPYGEIDMSSLETKFTVVGLDAGYAQARAGLIWDLLQNECMSPVVLLDELDKAGLDRGSDSATGFLYGLLEPISATRFADAAIGLPIDASHIRWIATCNRTDDIDPAILSRLTIAEIEQPTSEQMPAIVASIHRDVLTREDWGGWFEQPLPDEATAALALLSPRQVRLAIEEMYASAAMEGRRVVISADVPRPRASLSTRRSIGFVQDSTSSRIAS